MTQKLTPRNLLKGGPLRPNAAIAQEYSAAIMTLVRRMHDDTRRELRRVFDETRFHGAAQDAAGDDDATSGTAASQSRIAINALMDKYLPIFGRLARKATRRMMNRTLRNSAVTLGLSLREISKDLEISPDLVTPCLKEIVTASTTEAAGLIKSILPEYLGAVQGATMRAIVGGGGMQQLTPLLDELYKQNIRRARNTAMDQVRKSYSAMTAARMQDVGVRKFIWLHMGGTLHPRALHVELNGKECSLDDPPYIGEMYKLPVYGLPGQLPNCRCQMRPLISFGSEE